MPRKLAGIRLWDYRIDRGVDDAVVDIALGKAGSDGWELVHAAKTPYTLRVPTRWDLVFKRPRVNGKAQSGWLGAAEADVEDAELAVSKG